MKMTRIITGLLVWASLLAARATELSRFQSVCGTDYVSVGVGGMMGRGDGLITLTNVTGPISKAFLYWHGQIVVPPGGSPSATALVNGSVNGNPIVGTHLGFSGKNGWEPRLQASQACRADITPIVTGAGNGVFALSNFATNVSGASLIVFFDDGNPANNRDVVIYDGNDSNDDNAYDAAGWNFVVSGFDYSSGQVKIQMHVSDGQSYRENPITINGVNWVTGTARQIFNGTSVPTMNNYALIDPTLGLTDVDKGLWDIKTFDATAFAAAGPNFWTIGNVKFNEFFSLVVALLDVPAGSYTQCGPVTPGNSAPTITCTDAQTVEATLTTGVASRTIYTTVGDADGNPLTVTWKVRGVVVRTDTVAGGAGPTSATLSYTDVFAPGQNNFIEISVFDGIAAPLSCSTTVNVIEPIPPVVDCGAPVTFMAEPRGSFPLPNFKPYITATDNHTPFSLLVVASAPPIGTRLPPGEYDILIGVTDEALNTSACTKRVIILPNPANQPPVVECGADPVATTVASIDGFAPVPDLSAGIVVTDDYTPLEGLYFVQSPVAGTMVAVGTHTVNVAVYDEGGLLGGVCARTFVVEANPTANNPPSLDCGTSPSITLNAGNFNTVILPDLRGSVVASDDYTVNPIITQTPAPGTVLAVGSHTVTFVARDGGGLTSAPCVKTVVVIRNNPPVAVADYNTTFRNTPAVLPTVLANDTDPDGDTLSVAWVNASSVQGGTVVNNGGGVFTYTPPANYVGTDTFVYLVQDPGGLNAIGSVYIDVVFVNRPPVAGNDSAVTLRNTPVVISGVLANDNDPDGDFFFIRSFVAISAQGGFVTYNGNDGTFTYTPPSGYVGSDFFTYTIEDVGGLTSTATIFITVTAPVNNPPIAVDDVTGTQAGQPVTIPVLGNDSDPDGDTITVTAIGPVTGGTATLNANGTITFTPSNGFTGQATFTYTISDGNGGTATATVTVNVAAAVGCGSSSEGCDLYPITFHVNTIQGRNIGYCFDVYGGTGPGNFGWLTWVGSPNEPTLATSLTIPGDSHTYINPYNSGDRIVSVGDWVQGKPGISNSSSVRSKLDILKTIDIILPIYDTARSQGNNAEYKVVAFGIFRINSYRLPSQNRITATWLGYTDCRSVAPTAHPDTATTTSGRAVLIDVLANDVPGSSGGISVVGVGSFVGGTAQIVGNKVEFTPANGFTGTASFRYTVADSAGRTCETHVTVTVNAAPSGGCDLYPITLPHSTLKCLNVGQSVDIYAGTGPGNFGWLTWAGSPNEPTIAESLKIPGDSHTYVNPYNSSDRVVSVGDWVQGKPGISNSSTVRDRLDTLKTIDIVVPVYDSARSSGNNAEYKVIKFAKVRILDYRLPGSNRITAKFLGFTTCAQ